MENEFGEVAIDDGLGAFVVVFLHTLLQIIVKIHVLYDDLLVGRVCQKWGNL